jgi:CheY-like chemotaxis protein
MSGQVIVVDDDEDIREVITLLLDAYGYDAVGFASGVDAMAHLKAAPRPALVLVDLMMPGMNGAELLDRMHADPALAGIPTVILSGDVRGAEVAAATSADAIMVKPVDLDELVAVVERFANGHVRPHG